MKICIKCEWKHVQCKGKTTQYHFGNYLSILQHIKSRICQRFSTHLDLVLFFSQNSTDQNTVLIGGFRRELFRENIIIYNFTFKQRSRSHCGKALGQFQSAVHQPSRSGCGVYLKYKSHVLKKTGSW